MHARVQREATQGGVLQSSVDAAGAGKDGLRGSLKGMSFAEGEAALAPAQVPVQMKEGDKKPADAAPGDKAGGATATSTSRLGASGPWFEISGNFVSHDNLLKTADLSQAVAQNAYAEIPPGDRAIHQYTPVDAAGNVVAGATPVWVITTKACWQQHQSAVELARQAPYVPLRATLRNLGTGGVENDFWDIVVSGQDANGFREFRLIYWGDSPSGHEYYDVAGAQAVVAERSAAPKGAPKPKSTVVKSTVTSTTTSADKKADASKGSTELKSVSQPGDAKDATMTTKGKLDNGADGAKRKTHF